MADDDTLNDNQFKDFKYDGVKQVEKSITFDGTTGIGAIGTANVFAITGDVLLKAAAVCDATLTGTSVANLALGTAGTASVLITTTTPGTAIATGEIWHDASPDSGVELSSVLTEKIIADGAGVILTVAGANVTGGTLRFIGLWKPLSKDGKVEPAT